jgi:hypothetical protein
VEAAILEHENAGLPLHCERPARSIRSIMPDTSDFMVEAAPSRARRENYPPVVWLSLFCLDAPIVAVTWQWLFAHIFGAELHFPVRILLFFTAWLIYLADRFADTIKLSPANPISLRHRFCREHMIGWWIAIVIIFILDVSLALRFLDLQMLLLGGTLAAICALYLFVNHLLGGKWRPVPMKEKSIGILFAAGTALGVIGELPALSVSFGAALLLFAILCTYNCLSIAAWERDLDSAQGKTSFMTGWPSAARALTAIGYGLALVALASGIVWRSAWPLWLCLAMSALLLVRLNRAESCPRDQRTALADLVLLTPLIALLFSWR